MIISEMTATEMLSVGKKCIEEISTRAAGVIQHNLHRVKKSHSRNKSAWCNVDTRQMTTEDGTRWTVDIQARMGNIKRYNPYSGTKDFSVEKRLTIFTVITNSKTGYPQVISFGDFSGEGARIELYESHFFSRYRERFLGPEAKDLTIEDLALRYLKNEYLLYQTDGNLITCRTKEGVGFGLLEEDGKLIRNKTFITYDMVRDEGDQAHLSGKEDSVYNQNFLEFLRAETESSLEFLDESFIGNLKQQLK